MIKNIDHINIVVSNLEEAREFFLHFGFVEVVLLELAEYPRVPVQMP